MSRNYHLLPFRFRRHQDGAVLATNLCGDHLWMTGEQLKDFVEHQIDTDSALYRQLLTQHFAFEDDTRSPIHLLAAKYRTRQHRLADLTSLHIFVVTLRCTNQCLYCQTTCQDRLDRQGDMTTTLADHAIDFMFGSPSPYLKVEFQGGEPTINFDMVRYITEACEARAPREDKIVEFVLCTNLVEFSEEYASYCRQHRIAISTSLDGPERIHDTHRNGTHARVIRGIDLARQYVGVDQVSALMTPTQISLDSVEEIIDEYVLRGFHSIFLRSLHPYGYALTSQGITFPTERWLEFYERGLRHILKLNRQGIAFREEFAAILLRRILTHQPLGYVDLQSPAGAGTSVLVYFRDGVYLSDEARMLAAMGDHRFRLATLGNEDYATAMTADSHLSLLLETMTEGIPACVDCAYQPYCGADPIGHYREQGNLVGHKMHSEFCKRHLGAFDFIIGLLRGPDRDILTGWV